VDEEIYLIGCRIITLMAGGIAHNNYWINVAEHMGHTQIELPVGFFKLFSYDYTVELSRAFLDTEAIIERFENHSKPNLEERIRTAAVEMGLNPDEVVSQTSGDMVFSAEMTFGKQV